MPTYLHQAGRKSRAAIFAITIILVLFLPNVAHACALHSGVFDVGTGTMLPSGTGGTVSYEYTFTDQDQNRHGASKASAANNEHKRIKSIFHTVHAQYMFNREWGAKVSLPYGNRHLKTDHHGDIETQRQRGRGDIKLMGMYTGFSPDMSSGLLFGVKLPTGSIEEHGFHRDTTLGTGSTDIILGAYKIGYLTQDNTDWGWFAQALIDTPVLTRDHYRPGTGANAAVGARYNNGWRVSSKAKLVPMVQAVASGRLKDRGAEAESENSGHTRFLLSPGVELDMGKTKLHADVGIPVYENVRGNQLTAPAIFKIVASYKF